MSVRVSVLGPLRVGVGGAEPGLLALGRREAALLTVLALHRGRVVSTQRLVDELWPEAPPEKDPGGQPHQAEGRWLLPIHAAKLAGPAGKSTVGSFRSVLILLGIHAR